MTAITIAALIVGVVFWFGGGLFFIASEGRATRDTWNLFFMESKRWQWDILSTEERVFLSTGMWILAPILYPVLLLGAMGSFLLDGMRGFKKIIFRFRSRAFDELSEKLSPKEDE